MFAGEVRRKRVNRMRGFRHWRWGLYEMYVKLDGDGDGVPVARRRLGSRGVEEQ
jgi:hypothetical protein